MKDKTRQLLQRLLFAFQAFVTIHILDNPSMIMSKSDTLLFILIAIAILLLLALITILFLNSGTERTIGIFIKSIIGPLVLASVLLALDLFAPIELEKERIAVGLPRKRRYCEMFRDVLRDNASDHIAGLDLGWRLFLDPDSISFSKKDEQLFHMREAKQSVVYLDRMEAILYAWLIKNYPHWQMHREEYKTISGGSSGQSPKADAEMHPKLIDRGMIKGMLDESLFLRNSAQLDFAGQYFGLPDGASSRPRGPGQREF